MLSPINRISRRFRCAVRDRAGLATLEFALIAVAFMFLLFGTMDLARFFATQQGVRTVAADAARAALINPATPDKSAWTFTCAAPTSGIAAAVAASAPILAPTSLILCVSQSVDTITGKTTITATASYPFTSIISILAGANQTLSDTVTMSY